MTDSTREDNILRDLRKEFFAFRNGIIADNLRKAGDPHPIIMGCLLIDLVTITKQAIEAIDDDARATVAQALWDDIKSRECRLAAPMLYPSDLMKRETALQWCETVETIEVADNLCHKLLRNLKDADVLCHDLIASDKPLVKYTGYRLMLNLMRLEKLQADDSLKAIVKSEYAHAQPPFTTLLRDVMEECQGN